MLDMDLVLVDICADGCNQMTFTSGRELVGDISTGTTMMLGEWKGEGNDEGQHVASEFAPLLCGRTKR